MLAIKGFKRYLVISLGAVLGAGLAMSPVAWAKAKKGAASAPAEAPAAQPAQPAAAAPTPAPASESASPSGADAGARASGPALGEGDRHMSLTGNFPGGGSTLMSNALGARYFLESDVAVSGLFVFSSNTDNSKDRSIIGLGGKYQKFLAPASRRARPYGTGSIYLWKPSGDNNKPDDNQAFGVAGALGVEVACIPEISVFMETGLFIDASNKDKSETEIGTFTSAIGVNFNFDL